MQAQTCANFEVTQRTGKALRSSCKGSNYQTIRLKRAGLCFKGEGAVNTIRPCRKLQSYSGYR